MTGIRPARPEDAPVLAALIDMAGEGIPAYMWSLMAERGESPFDVGCRRAAREEGAFSYRNAHVAEIDGEAVAMVLGYRQPDPFDAGDLDGLPAFIRVLAELEALAPGSWYINALAALPDHRGKGLGERLLAFAEALARESGASMLSLIVDSHNGGALRLYERAGYAEAARRPVVPFPGRAEGGDWLLMTCPMDRAREGRP